MTTSNDAIALDRSTMRRASEIYQDTFGSKMYLSTGAYNAVLKARTWTELFELEEDNVISVGELDAFEAAIDEQ
jgi:hypothetical protein